MAIGLSVNDYFHAKNDNQRLYAGLNAVSAGVAMVNPVVGLIMSVCVLVTQLVDNALSANMQKDLLQVYARIAEHYKRIAEINEMSAKADQQIFVSAVDRINTANNGIQTGYDFLQANCTKAETLDEFSKIEACATMALQVMAQYEIVVGQSTVLLDFKSEHFQADAIFTALNTSRADFQVRTKDFGDRFDKFKTTLREQMSQFARLTYDLIVAKSEDLQIFSAKELFGQHCVDSAQDLSTASAVAIAALPSANKTERTEIKSVTLRLLEERMEGFKEEGCLDLKTGTASIDNDLSESTVLLLKQQKLVKKMRSI